MSDSFVTPMDCSTPGSSVHGISQAGISEWVVIPFSREYSRSRDQTHISCIGGQILYWATRDAQMKLDKALKKRLDLITRITSYFFTHGDQSALPVTELSINWIGSWKWGKWQRWLKVYSWFVCILGPKSIPWESRLNKAHQDTVVIKCTIFLLV